MILAEGSLKHEIHTSLIFHLLFMALLLQNSPTFQSPILSGKLINNTFREYKCQSLIYHLFELEDAYY